MTVIDTEKDPTEPREAASAEEPERDRGGDQPNPDWWRNDGPHGEVQ